MVIQSLNQTNYASRHSDSMYLHNIIRMMEQHLHKQLYLHQHEMYITVLHNRYC